MSIMTCFSPAEPEPYQSMTRGSAGQNKKITSYLNCVGLTSV
jgi:hypothetical protein